MTTTFIVAMPILGSSSSLVNVSAIGTAQPASPTVRWAATATAVSLVSDLFVLSPESMELHPQKSKP